MTLGQIGITIPELERKSIQYRRTLLTIIKEAGAGHTGGDLSCIDILNVLYNQTLNVTPATFKDPARDRYIHSKHSTQFSLIRVFILKRNWKPLIPINPILLDTLRKRSMV